MTWLGTALGLPEPPALAKYAAAARAVTGGDVIAFPGLVNSHDHLEFNCYPPTGNPPYRDFVEWSKDVQAARALLDSVRQIPIETRRQIGILKNLLWGVTAVADHGGNGRSEIIDVIPQPGALHSPELARWPRLRLATGTGKEVLHLGEGITEQSRAHALDLLRWNVRRRPIAGVHAVSLAGKDFSRLNAMIWCPGSNNFLFDRTADAATASRFTRILFGTDSTLSAPGTLWDHLRAVRGIIPDPALFSALTTAASAFWGLPPKDGSFVLAKRRFRDDWDAFYALTPEDILLVSHRNEIGLFDAILAGKPDMPDECFLLETGNYGKCVRMPLRTIFRTLLQATPTFDTASLVARFMGITSDRRRAA